MAQFGLQIEPQFGFTFDQVAALAHECRGHGYTSLWVSDHFLLDNSARDINCLECWTLLSALAVEVKDLRLGSLVSCMAYRNPALLAKMAATVDMVSKGRLEFGTGAGWKDIEYAAYGYDFPTPGERVDRFIEGVQIIKSLWTQPVTTFRGKYYRVEAAVAAPKPTQKPHPPVLIGGSKPRMLRVMARYADAVNMGGSPDPKAYAETLSGLEKACQEVGTDFNRIRKTHFMSFVVGRNGVDVLARLTRVAARENMSPDQYRAKRARTFIGTPAGVVELLKRYTDLGVTQFMTVFPWQEERESMRLFADEVIPKV
ncbi:MAG: LLM class flavin-dependent oxidoreductase [Dehalococcoidia bacterium]|nr:LLM class flavin-dependent oxidoreductase [Dehalococcoidia bacterium]MSQ35328.1 LLM class flavin-dependent oxidoreductase [Dehalococcoidia bacterium]